MRGVFICRIMMGISGKVLKIALLVVAIMLIATDGVYSQTQKLGQSAEQLQKLMRAYSSLDRLYFEEVDKQPIVEEAIRAMFSKLDPHSTYIDADEMKVQREMTKGQFGGVGIAYNIYRDSIVVMNILADGPARKTGMRLGDRIVEVDGDSVVGVERSEVQKLLRGEQGSTVEIGVVRRGEPNILRLSIVRDNIPVTTIDAAYKVDDKIGYIKVNRFADSTMREFRDAMGKIAGVETLILDLSDNGGGLMHQAVDLADYFLPKGVVITSTEGRAVQTTQYISKQEPEFDGRLIVIINQNSASGSELVAGALQDWDRAIVVGRNSYGKGLVQREIPLGDGSAIRLTIARYHTPSGRVIQRPFELGHKEDYAKAYVERLRKMVSNTDSLSLDSVEMPRFNTLLRGRTIYGGGGIIPDVRVAVDTTRLNSYASQITARGVIVDFVVEYMDNNREKLAQQYPTFEQFDSEFVLSDSEMGRFVEIATAKGVEHNQAKYEAAYELLRNQLTAQIVQQLYPQSDFYRYINKRENDLFRRAMQLAQNWSSEVEPVIGVAHNKKVQ